MGDYSISDKAAADLAKLWQRITDESGREEIADKFVDGLFASFRTLADVPDIAKPRDYTPPGVLAFPHDNYMIFLVKTDQGVEIAHVLYGGMDFRSYFSEA